MFTGHYASQHTGDWTSPLDDRYPTLADAFTEAGYATGGFTANLVATTRGFGLDRGFVRYEDHRRSLGQIVLSTSLAQAQSPRLAFERLVFEHWVSGALEALARFTFEPRYSYPDNDPKPAPMVVGSFLRWQREIGGRPFFAFLNFFDAHGPYESPARYDTLFAKGDKGRDKYDRSIRFLDDELAILFDSLRARGILDKTVVVLAADHGEQFGEHGLGWHGNSLYEQLVHVPLLIRYPPKVPGGVRVRQQVSLRDLAATMADLSDLSTGAKLAGVSLARTWSPDSARGSGALAELSRGINTDADSHNAIGNMHAFADDSLHFIRNGNGSLEIYAYRRDPRETENLAKGPWGALAPQFEAQVTAALGAAVAGAPPRKATATAPPPVQR
jgi:arylsulfatase A-like enzyme